jgi:hypothetical protein
MRSCPEIRPSLPRLPIDLMTMIDTQVRHVTKLGANLFRELGFSLASQDAFRRIAQAEQPGAACAELVASKWAWPLATEVQVSGSMR